MPTRSHRSFPNIPLILSLQTSRSLLLPRWTSLLLQLSGLQTRYKLAYLTSSIYCCSTFLGLEWKRDPELPALLCLCPRTKVVPQDLPPSNPYRLTQVQLLQRPCCRLWREFVRRGILRRSRELPWKVRCLIVGEVLCHFCSKDRLTKLNITYYRMNF